MFLQSCIFLEFCSRLVETEPCFSTNTDPSEPRPIPVWKASRRSPQGAELVLLPGRHGAQRVVRGRAEVRHAGAVQGVIWATERRDAFSDSSQWELEWKQKHSYCLESSFLSRYNHKPQWVLLVIYVKDVKWKEGDRMLSKCLTNTNLKKGVSARLS